MFLYLILLIIKWCWGKKMGWVNKGPDVIEQVTTRGFNVWVSNFSKYNIDCNEVAARCRVHYNNPISYAKLVLGQVDLKIEQHQIEAFNQLERDSIKFNCVVNPFNWNIQVEILNAN